MQSGRRMVFVEVFSAVIGVLVIGMASLVTRDSFRRFH